MPHNVSNMQNTADDNDIRSSEGLNSSLEDYEGDSESDDDVIMQPAVDVRTNQSNYTNLETNNLSIRKDETGMLAVKRDSNVNKKIPEKAHTPVAKQWLPKMNLLELAYRLKQAEHRVFGPGSGQSVKRSSTSNGTGSIAEGAGDTPRWNVSSAALNDASSKSTGTNYFPGVVVPPKITEADNSFSANAYLRNQQGRNFPAHCDSSPQSNLSSNAVAAYNNRREVLQDDTVTNRRHSHHNQGVFERNAMDSEMQNYDALAAKRESFRGYETTSDRPNLMQASSMFFAAESTGIPSVDTRRRHQCSFCKYRSDTRSHVRRHELSIHYHGATARHRGPRDFRGVSPMNVPQAPQTEFTSVVMPSEMLRTGLDVRRHQCDLCTYNTDSISHLKRHQCSVHGKEKPFSCTVCLREFSRSEKVHVVAEIINN